MNSLEHRIRKEVTRTSFEDNLITSDFRHLQVYNKVSYLLSRAREEQALIVEQANLLEEKKLPLFFLKKSVEINGKQWVKDDVERLYSVLNLVNETVDTLDSIYSCLEKPGIKRADLTLPSSRELHSFDNPREFIELHSKFALELSNQMIELKTEILSEVNAIMEKSTEFIGDKGRNHARQMLDLKRLNSILERNYKLAYLHDSEFALAYLTLHSKLPLAMRNLETAKQAFDRGARLRGELKGGSIISKLREFLPF